MALGKQQIHDLKTAALLGVIAGMRAMLAPVIVTRALSAAKTPTNAARCMRGVTSAASIVEAFGDKAPFVPVRTRALPLVGRVLSGGICAYYAIRQDRRVRVVGTVIGMVTAAVSSYAMSRMRMYASARLGLPNAAAGLIEDGLALVAAREAGRRLEGAW